MNQRFSRVETAIVGCFSGLGFVVALWCNQVHGWTRPYAGTAVVVGYLVGWSLVVAARWRRYRAATPGASWRDAAAVLKQQLFTPTPRDEQRILTWCLLVGLAIAISMDVFRVSLPLPPNTLVFTMLVFTMLVNDVRGRARHGAALDR